MRLLVVEDDLKLGRLLTESLRYDGFGVERVVSGQEALVEARIGSYDVIILDVMLGDGIDGYEVCARIRDARVWTPLIMLTARSGESDRVRGLDAGADDYLVKPFSLAELSARIRALIRRGLPERPTTLRVGGLELDPAARTVKRDGVELGQQLTPREFRLLEILMRNQGIVLSQEQLLDRLWGRDKDEVSNVVEQTVRYLRGKVDKPYGTADIETVRGFGYRIRRRG